jgi:hypothetical protein
LWRSDNVNTRSNVLATHSDCQGKGTSLEPQASGSASTDHFVIEILAAGLRARLE